MILLDTNVVSELIKPSADGNVLAWFDRVADLNLYISAITEAELWLGLYSLPEGKRRDVLELDLQAILTEEFADRILLFESRAALAYGKIFGKRKSLGLPIHQEDCAIAAIARVHSLKLATRDAGGFEQCGVELINPWVSVR